LKFIKELINAYILKN